jgi:hypothetical protein
MVDTYRCENCGHETPLEDVLGQQLELALAIERARLEGEQTAALADQEEKLRTELRAEFEADRALHEQALEDRAKEKVAVDLADRQALIDEQAEELKEARARELEFRKERRLLEEEKANQDLETARRVDEEVKAAEQKAVEREQELHRLELAEKEQELKQMRQQIRELKESEDTSPGLRGVVLELDLEDQLRLAFAGDRVEPIKTGGGVRGADVLQGVSSPRGVECGLIIFESKRTKTWQQTWIPKLRDDQRRAKADMAVLVSTTLPSGARLIEWREGVWVVHPSCVLALATMLRFFLLQAEQLRAVETNRAESRDALYAYLSSNEFAQHVLSILEVGVAIRTEREKEMLWKGKSWARQEKEEQKLFASMAGVYGTLQGIMGAALAPVEPLELPPAA